MALSYYSGGPLFAGKREQPGSVMVDEHFGILVEKQHQPFIIPGFCDCFIIFLLSLAEG